MIQTNLPRRIVAEFIGSTLLLSIIVGSGIMGERLANGNAAVALLANSIATGTGLVFLIYGFADISGAHFNPVVTVVETLRENLTWRESILYVLFQIGGALLGVALANTMFDLPVFFASTKVRAGNSQFLSEFIATFGLIGVISMGVKFRPHLVPVLVACYITAAYWFTSSTSFANPAVTLARSASDTFAGISLSSVPMFIVAQLLGSLAAMLTFGWLLQDEKEKGNA